MNNDETRPVAASYDSLSSEYNVTIEEAVLRYAHAGHPRTPRSIQRYCANGHLDCRLVETQFGEKYKIDAASIDRHIAFIEEVRPVTTGHGEPRRDAPQNQALFNETHYRQAASPSYDTLRQAQPSAEMPRQMSLPVMPSFKPQNSFQQFTQPTTSQDNTRDMTRLDATSRGETRDEFHADVREGGEFQNVIHSQPQSYNAEQEVKREEQVQTMQSLPQPQTITPPAPTPIQDKMQEKLVELLEKENNFLRNQISTKDEQIKDLTERARETNHLIGGLQRMLTPLLGSGGQRDGERQEEDRKRFWQGN
jgi:ATP-dependent exoDNAse (exonuclease V) beta subunit